ncbi:MAG TPA: replication-relaxation family protein [Jatrophihabitans sp.]|nr:replication-relaxation family protein [Jatrophihabitans sp.]
MLGLLADHRFLTTTQVSGFLFHAHASVESGSRVCRRVLQRLERFRLVERPVRRVGGLSAGSASSIWMLTSAGHRLRSLRDGLGAVGRVREPGERFIRHYLAVADAHLALTTAARAGQFELVRVELEPRCWRPYSGLGGSSETLKPDLYAVTANGEYEDHWFIEVDRATESLPTLIRQCQQYETYRRSGREQAERGLFPRVLWVVPDERRADKLDAALRLARNLDRQLFRITTPEHLIDIIAGGPA